jgi:hypothetical protein
MEVSGDKPAARKRTTSTSKRGKAQADAAEKVQNRGSYACGKCGAPKKGHTCPFETVFRAPGHEAKTGPLRDSACQVEIGTELVRDLDTTQCGSYYSYIPTAASPATVAFTTATSPSSGSGPFIHHSHFDPTGAMMDPGPGPGPGGFYSQGQGQGQGLARWPGLGPGPGPGGV